MVGLRQILILFVILLILGWGPRLLRRFGLLKKGAKKGAQNLKDAVDGSDEVEIEGEVLSSKMKKEKDPST